MAQAAQQTQARGQLEAAAPQALLACGFTQTAGAAAMPEQQTPPPLFRQCLVALADYLSAVQEAHHLMHPTSRRLELAALDRTRPRDAAVAQVEE